MKKIRFGKGKSFSNKPTNSLTKCVVPSLDMVGFSLILACRCVVLKNDIVSFPEIAECLTGLVFFWELASKVPDNFFQNDPQCNKQQLALYVGIKQPKPIFDCLFEKRKTTTHLIPEHRPVELLKGYPPRGEGDPTIQ